MTQQTAIANLKKNTLYDLYNIVLKEEGGICTSHDLSALKTKVRGVLTSCVGQEIYCEEPGSKTLLTCVPVNNTCANIINISAPITQTYVSGATPLVYLFSLPLLPNLTYTWSTSSSGFLINSTLNTCTAQSSDGKDACALPITINCLIQEPTYGCTLLKTLILGIIC